MTPERKRRRQLEATYKKCPCGNTLGLAAIAEGRELCGFCQQVEDDNQRAMAQLEEQAERDRKIDALIEANLRYDPRFDKVYRTDGAGNEIQYVRADKR